VEREFTMSTADPDLGVPVRNFNHHTDPALRVDPFTAFDRFRDEPIFWTPELDGFWVLTRYADIREVLRDGETFSSRHTLIPPIDWPRDRANRGQRASADWAGYRKLLVHSVTGPAGAAVAMAVERACVRLVTRLAPLGRCDLVADFAQPLRDALFAALFDVPEAETERCARWASDLLQDVDPDRRVRAAQDFRAYVGQGIAACASGRRTGTGLLRALATADVDGRPLREDEAVDLAFKMGIGSVDTITNSIGFSFRYLATHPDLQRRLATESAAAGLAADELLRLHSVACVARVATRDTEIAGTRVRAGERILLSLALADRDPCQYPDPASADFDRSDRTSHLAFGSGAHRCVGARIAVQALTVALREWHHAIQDYALAEDADPRTAGGAVWSLGMLPLTWPVHNVHARQRYDLDEVQPQGGPL
jgi:cytochrome P450